MVISLPNEVLQHVITLQTLNWQLFCFGNATINSLLELQVHSFSELMSLQDEMHSLAPSWNSKSKLIYGYGKHARRNLWPNIAHVSEIYIILLAIYFISLCRKFENFASSKQFLMLWTKNNHFTLCFTFQEFVGTLAYIT